MMSCSKPATWVSRCQQHGAIKRSYGILECGAVILTLADPGYRLENLERSEDSEGTQAGWQICLDPSLEGSVVG